MLGSIAMGLVAALAVVLPRYIGVRFPGFSWSSPLFLLVIAAIAMLLQRYVINRRPGSQRYDGLADIFIHIHSSANPDSGGRWQARGLISFLLNLFGGAVGPEGAAVEITHGIALMSRTRSSRWFEQRRRTDAAMALGAGISAAFGAPFAAICLPAEMGIGGRTITTILSSLSAFMGARYLMGLLQLKGFDVSGALFSFRLLYWQEWVGVAAISVVAGLMGVVTVRFIRYSQDSLTEIFQKYSWLRTAAGGALLFLVAFVYPPGHEHPRVLLENVLWSRAGAGEAGLMFFTQFLSLTLIISAFGTVGVFWPIFALGGFMGFCTDHWILREVPGFTAAAGLIGGAAFWGALLGAPLSGAIVAYEMTQNLVVLLPCFVAAYGARRVCLALKTRSIVDKNLEARGVALIEGRSASVLDSVFVRDAMVTDHETVSEQESVSSLYARLLKSRYPFLPVVNAHGRYSGLLTADMIQEAWQTHEPAHSNSPLSKLLEAKDLLYRTGFKSPTVKVHDPLSATTGMFEVNPCIPVLDDQGRVVGLLFVYNVRLAYDREVARRSLSLHSEMYRGAEREKVTPQV